MYIKNSLLLALYIFFVGIVSGQTVSNKTNPDWLNNGDWTQGAPGYLTTQPAILNHESLIAKPLIVRSEVTVLDDKTLFSEADIIVSEGGELLIEGVLQLAGGNLTIENGGVLRVVGLVEGLTASNITILEGGSLIVEGVGGIQLLGNWESVFTSSSIVIDGSVVIENNMTVNTNITGTGNILVNGAFELEGGSVFGCSDSNSGCCGSARVSSGSECYIPENSEKIFTSIATGEWDDKSTWDQNEVPKDNDDVIIGVGHTVSLKNGKGPKIFNFTLLDNSEFIQDNKEMEINGNYTNNSLHKVVKKELKFNGENKVLSGQGEVFIEGVNDNAKVIVEQNTIIQNGSNLLFIESGVTGGVEVKKGEVTNNGIVQMAANVTSDDGEWINSTGSDLFLFEEVFEIPLVAKADFNTVHYSDVANQEIIVPEDETYNNLVIGGGGVKLLTSDIIIQNFLAINGTLDVDEDENYAIEIAGNFLNKGTFYAREGKVTLNGNDDQEIFDATGQMIFYDCELNIDSANALLVSDLQVKNELVMVKGNFWSGGARKVVLGESTDNPGVLIHNDESFIDGDFERWISDASSEVLFPVGAENKSHFFKIQDPSITPGSLQLRFSSDPPTNNGAPWSENGVDYYNTFADGYYEVVPLNGFDISSFSCWVDTKDLKGFPVSGVEQLVTRVNTTSPWIFEGTAGTNEGTYLKRDGLSALQDIAIVDELNCAIPAQPIFTVSSTDVCIEDQEIEYTVLNPGGSLTWEWSLINGEILEGQGTESIKVNWADQGGVGEVNVRAVDAACGVGESERVSVSIAPFVTSPISGKSILAEFSTGEAYSVDLNAGYVYTWSVSGGTVVSGGTTNAIVVDWQEAGSGVISVVAEAGVCPEASPEVLDITLFTTFTSSQSGDFNDPSTWIGEQVPGDSANIRVYDGHVVTLNDDVTLGSVIIDTLATLDNDAYQSIILNSYELDGSHTGTQDIGKANIVLNASINNAVIEGYGTIEVNELTIISGVWVMDRTSDITINAEKFEVSTSSLDVLGSLTIGKSFEMGLGGSFFALNGLSNILYNGTSSQSIAVPSDAYYNLYLENTGVKSLAGDVFIQGDLLDETDSFDANNYKVTFSGGSVQTVDAASKIEFSSVTINNYSSELVNVVFKDSSVISGLLELRQGVLGFQEQGAVSLTNTAVLVGGNVETYIDGPVYWNIGYSNVNLFIPLGNDGKFAPLEINLASPGAFSFEYFKSPYSNLTVDGSLNNVSEQEHWNVESFDGTTANWLRLYYYDAVFSGIIDVLDLRGSNYTSEGWTETDEEPFWGDANLGKYVQSFNQSEFGPVTFGSKYGGNPLPIDLLVFDGKYGEEGILLYWATLSEQNNDRFEIEASVDGNEFRKIAEVPGAGNSNSIRWYNYNYLNPEPGLNYFRLKQVDFDGRFTYSNVLLFNYDVNNKRDIVVYPNPSNGVVNVSFTTLREEPVLLEVYNQLGKRIYSVTEDVLAPVVSMDLSSLESGVYVLVFTQGAERFRAKLVLTK